jgi:UMF1 family MFS transporter
MKKGRELSQLLIFLATWFIYSDAFTTLVNVAILFAQSELGADQPILLSATAIFPIFAGLGIKFWLWFQRKFKYSTQRMIFIQCVLYSLLPLYGLIGFWTQPGTFLGLNNKFELPLAAAYHGFMLGATSSSCRVLFSELLPHSHEAEFFGLYRILY